ETAARLDGSVQEAVRNGSEVRSRQLHDLPVLIAKVTASMDEFQERRRQARESSRFQAARNQENCEAIESLVASLQFHDITRQQVEHVAQALREAAFRPKDLNAALVLQSSQLGSAERAFTSSVTRIEGDLESIAARVGEMAADGGSLLGIA